MTIEQSRVFQSLAAGLDVTQAAIAAGVTRDTVKRWVRERGEAVFKNRASRTLVTPTTAGGQPPAFTR